MLKEKNYTFSVPAIADMVPENTETVLDVGCSGGALGQYLKNVLHCKEVVGIEHSASAATRATEHLDYVFNENACAYDLPEKYDGYFDLIIYADVLEHLYDPWGVVKKHKRLLKDNGMVLVSIPNVRNLFILLNLLSYRFDYTANGLLDDTHIRFFTRKTIQEVFNKNGFVIDDIKRSIRDSKWHKTCSNGKNVDLNLLRTYEDVYQKFLNNEDCSKVLRKYVGVYFSSKESVADFLTVQYYMKFKNKNVN